jgi:hypothetical protein
MSETSLEASKASVQAVFWGRAASLRLLVSMAGWGAKAPLRS